jgi:hypothetical protein
MKLRDNSTNVIRTGLEIAGGFDRALLIGFVSVLLIFGVGLLRAPEGSKSELSRDEFFRSKVDQPAIYDMVLGGDSRVLCDLSPRAMSSILDKKILNFGFNFAGFDRSYLSATEEKLIRGYYKKAIVFGITPRAFTPLNMKVSGYIEENSRRFHEKIIQRYFSSIMSMLRPFLISSIVLTYRGRVTEKNFFRDGHMSVKIDPPDERFDLKTYNKIFIGNQVSPEHISEFLANIAEITSRGVEVYAFSPPVSEGIFRAEERYSGFDRSQFVAKFQQAGGVWIDVDARGIVLADGSHVTESDVPEYSIRLALAIKQIIDK